MSNNFKLIVSNSSMTNWQLTKFSIWFWFHFVSSAFCGQQNLIIRKPIQFGYCFAIDHFERKPTAKIYTITEMRVSKCWGADYSEMCQIDNWQNVSISLFRFGRRMGAVPKITGLLRMENQGNSWQHLKSSTGHFWSDQETLRLTERLKDYKSSYVRWYLSVLFERCLCVRSKFCLRSRGST